MKKKTSEDKSNTKENRRMRLNLVGLNKGDEAPDLVVKAIDPNSQTIHVSKVDEKGNFDIPEGILKKAHRITVGPNVKKDESAEPENIIKYRVSQFINLIERGAINIAKPLWERWYFRFRCVTGRVRLCRRHPIWYYDLIKAVNIPQLNVKTALKSSNPSIGLSKSIQLDRVSNSLSELVYGKFRCYTVCNGTVEVYRRTCCCRPWIIDDLRYPELIRDLKDLVRGIPDIPPIPDLPDPPPEIEKAFFEDGTLNELKINAPRDLEVILSLQKAEIAEYINARPYLICRGYSCSNPVKVAKGNINPNGRFNICWLDFQPVNRPFCHDEYAYIVKQKIFGTTFTIYNGVAANIWFGQNDDVTLTSYSRFAFACRENGELGTGAFVYLDIIGDTGSWNLKTPNPTGWDRVASPAYNDGLVFPASSPAAAMGANLNRNWGGTLKLNYMFSEDMQTIGAKYYRISISEADNNGNPTGSPEYLPAGPTSAALSWEKSVIVGTTVEVHSENLGPNTVGGNPFLYKIPYDREADHTPINWSAGQYHGYLNTEDSRWNDPTKRHLVTVEVFDDAGNRLRPIGTPATGLSGGEIEADFTYRRRYQDLGPTANVPYAALTHMFWWDNRELTAQIEYLNLNGAVSLGECQFLEGGESSTFGIGYRAYHLNEMFQLSHGISWKRGLGPTTGTLLASSSNNVGQPPAPAGNSPTNTFHQMLHSNPSNPANPHGLKKCAFAVFLGISSKTTDGDYLGNHGITETAAFALEIT